MGKIEEFMRLSGAEKILREIKAPDSYISAVEKARNDSMETLISEDGGSGSGNWGHIGVHGVRGGSAPGGGKPWRQGGSSAGEYTSFSKELSKKISSAKSAAEAKGIREESKKSYEVHKATVEKKADIESKGKVWANNAAAHSGKSLPKEKKPVKESEKEAEKKPESAEKAPSSKGEIGNNPPYSAKTMSGYDKVAAQKKEMQVSVLGKEKFDQVSKDMTSIIEKSPVTSWTHAEFLGDILDDHYKNQFEVSHSEGLDDKYVRAKVAKAVFGIPNDVSKNLNPDDREKYGCFGSKDAVKNWDNGSGEGYGDGDEERMQIVWKDSIKNQTTYTVGDSLDMALENEGILAGKTDGSGALGISDFSLKIDDMNKTVKSIHNVSQSKDEDAIDLVGYPGGKDSISAGYIEAQIHGNPGMADIAEIRFSGSSALKYQEQVERAQKAGIKCTVVDTFKEKATDAGDFFAAAKKASEAKWTKTKYKEIADEYGIGVKTVMALKSKYKGDEAKLMAALDDFDKNGIDPIDTL